MSNQHNYSQYSKQNPKNDRPKTDKPVAAAPEEVKMVVERSETAAPVVVNEAPVAPIEPVVMQETVETAPLPELVSGVVVNCAKLNVRAEPSMFADVVCVLEAASEIEIDVSRSNHEWFKIHTAIGAEGYCMRKFVNAYL